MASCRGRNAEAVSTQGAYLALEGEGDGVEEPADLLAPELFVVEL